MSRGRGRALDRLLGITLGVALGVGIVTAFVFLGSESTIDAPRISGIAANPQPGLPKPGKQTPTVRAIGGAPPPSGPVRLRFKRGEKARFRVLSDIPIGIEIPGYGIHANVERGLLVSFRADRLGEFPVIVSDSHIAIASLLVTR